MIRSSWSFIRNSSFSNAKICIAKYAELMAPALPMATVATGIPAGICTVERRASIPESADALIGTPIIGLIVLEDKTPAK